MPDADHNILVYMLTDPDARRLFGAAWADEAQRVVAQFRTTHDPWAGDPAFLVLLDRLRRDSPAFPLWWAAHDIRNVGAGAKLLDLPGKGPQRSEYTTFQVNDDPALKLAIYTPA